jgi:hypothetical protein
MVGRFTLKALGNVSINVPPEKFHVFKCSETSNVVFSLRKRASKTSNLKFRKRIKPCWVFCRSVILVESKTRITVAMVNLVNSLMATFFV